MRWFFPLLSAVVAVGSVQAQHSPTPAAPILGFATGPYGSWSDPADSLYRLAHELLARGEYGRSAQMFKELTEKYPKSGYQDDLPYNEAFARYKIGTLKELETAARLLEPSASKLLGVVPASTSSKGNGPVVKGRSRMSEGDVVGLYIRVNQALAQRGNHEAGEIIRNLAQSSVSSCDADDIRLKREAMGALSQMDRAQALPILKNVLNKIDDCTIDLRRSALFILGGRGDGEAASIIASIAKTDPSTTMRVEAINWLPRLQGDAGVNTLEEILRTEQEERIQRAVVRTLNSSDNPRARRTVRTLIDRKDAPINVRIEAVTSFVGDRVTSDDATYLRGLYARADADELKAAIIAAVSRIGGQGNDEWILDIAKNRNEASQVRSAAIMRLTRSSTTATDLMKLYDAADSYDLRSRIVTALDGSREAEAADKLAEIARTSTVARIKVQALSALNRRKDPRAVQIVEEIMRGRP